MTRHWREERDVSTDEVTREMETEETRKSRDTRRTFRRPRPEERRRSAGGVSFRPAELASGAEPHGPAPAPTTPTTPTTPSAPAGPSAERFQLTVEQAPTGVAHVAMDGQFLYVNPALCRILGYERDELLTRTFQDITYPDDLPADLAYVKRLLADELTSYDMDKRYLQRDGTPVWVHVNASLVRTANGEPDFFIGIFEDISERKQLERDMRAIQVLSDAALAHMDLEDLLRELLGRLLDVMDADNAAILLADEAGQQLSIYSARGPEEQATGRIRIPVGEGVAGRIAATRQPLIVSDLTAVEVANPLLQRELRSLVGVPLVTNDRLVGVMHVSSAAPRRFGERDVRLLRVVADRVALALDRARLHERVQAQARELASVIGAMADGVWVVDDEGQIIQHNAAFRTIWGMDADPNFLSGPVEERAARLRLRDEAGASLIQEMWPTARVLRGEVLTGEQSAEVRVRRLDGQERFLSISGAPIRDDGRILGAVLMVRDTTERRSLAQRTHEALQALLAMAEVLVHGLEAQPGDGQTGAQPVAERLAEVACKVLGCQRVAILTVDPDGNTLRPLAAAGLTPQQERAWREDNAPGRRRMDSGTAPDVVERLRAGEVVVVDLRKPPYRGAAYARGVGVTLLAPLRLRDQLVGMLSASDAQAGRQFSPAEIELAGAVAKLVALAVERDRLLREREEAQASAMALRESTRRMDEFLGIVSHELKTPVTTLKANLQLAAKRLKPFVTAEPVLADLTEAELAETFGRFQVLLARAESSIDRLVRMVDDLLDVSRVRAGKLQLDAEAGDLAVLVRESVEEQRQVHPDRAIHLTLPAEGPVWVMADPGRIMQVVTNFLTNALKYSLASEPVEVRLETDEQSARVAVSDRGPGLSLEQQRRIWEPFYRADGVLVLSGSGIGLGLGLHICKTIVERLGGEVGVESEEGAGCVFWFTLPLLHPARSAEALPESGARGGEEG